MMETTPTAEATHVEVIRQRLQDSPTPLKLADAVKGVKPPKGTKAPRFREQVRELLEEEVRLGRLFAQPSGKAGEIRYWSRDERQQLRQRALELAATPQPLASLKSKLGKEVKGVDAGYALAVVQELINDERLFEHPPKAKGGQPLFGAARHRHLDRHGKALAKIVAECNKLLAAGVPAEELLAALRGGLAAYRPAPPAPTEVSAARADAPQADPEQAGQAQAAPASAEPVPMEEMILKAVAESTVVSLASLRAEMPREFQGRAFDEAVLRLADDLKVTISEDADPSRFSEQEAAAYVRDGGHLYTTIMARS